VVELIVNDGHTDSLPDSAILSTRNSKPVADGGPDQAVVVGATEATVTLDGRGSSDANHDSLTFRWSFTVLPEGSTAALSDPTAAQPTFIADLPGMCVLQLIVNDGQEDSALDDVVIPGGRQPPARGRRRLGHDQPEHARPHRRARQ